MLKNIFTLSFTLIAMLGSIQVKAQTSMPEPNWSRAMARVLRTASTTFSDAENLALLEYSVKRAPAGNAALAIAILAPARLDQPEMAELMFRTLERQKLGSAAALVLSASTDPEIHKRLARVADQENTLASKRAALAIGQLKAERAGDER